MPIFARPSNAWQPMGRSSSLPEGNIVLSPHHPPLQSKKICPMRNIGPKCHKSPNPSEVSRACLMSHQCHKSPNSSGVSKVCQGRWQDTIKVLPSSNLTWENEFMHPYSTERLTKKGKFSKVGKNQEQKNSEN